MSTPPFIAEVSSNHGCDLERAIEFIAAAARAGCAGVKFQQFKIDALFSPEALAHDPQLRRRRAWELPVEFNAPLADRARAEGLQFASTPFYFEAIEELEPHVDFFKISSYQLLWSDFLREVARTGKPVVLATGMADLIEVDGAVEALAAGGCDAPTLLHCVSLYPTPPDQVGLGAIETMRSRYGVPIGWSDHSVSAEVVARAVRRFDAALVEFHMDLDRAGEEYAFGHCWLPEQIGELIRSLGEYADPPLRSEFDGNGLKLPLPEEAHEREWRSDPADGLRPLKRVRFGLRPARVAEVAG